MKYSSLYKINLLALFFFLGTVASYSQTQNLEWSAESYLVTINMVDVEITSNLTKQNSVFTWEQLGYNTSDTSTFNIAAISGNWNAQDNIGALNYELTSDGLSAALTLTGTTEGITLLLSINGANNTTSDSYTFYIETFTNL